MLPDELKLPSILEVSLTPFARQLFLTSLKLDVMAISSPDEYEDYGFVIFPIAKAYEGCLKSFLYLNGLISQETYEGNRFRIGKALNPDVYPQYRDQDWLYDDLVKQCGGQELPREIWNTWLQCRNHVFHYFPKEETTISAQEAHQKVLMVLNVTEKIFLCLSQKGKGINAKS